MTPDLPPEDRVELEARVTAFVLGELPPGEAEAVSKLIAEDRELARWRDQLQVTLGLLRETVSAPDEKALSAAAPLKMSNARRERSLAHFKTVRPMEFERSKSRAFPWQVRIACAAAVVFLLGVLVIPNFVRSRSTSQQNAIINNLRTLDAAKQQWALEQGKSANDTPTEKDLLPYMGRGSRTELPATVSGESYVIGPVGKPPVAVTKNGKVTVEGEVDQREAALDKDLRKKMVDGVSALQQSSTEASVTTGRRRGIEPLLSQSAPRDGSANAAKTFGTPSVAQGKDRELDQIAKATGDNRSDGALEKNKSADLQPALQVPEAPPGAIPNGTIATAAHYAFSDNLPRNEVRESEQKITAVTGVPAITPDMAVTSTVTSLDASTRRSFGVGAAGESAKSAPVQLQTAANSDNVYSFKLGLSQIAEEVDKLDAPLARRPLPVPLPQGEIKTSDQAFSTFSLNVSDVSFRLGAASLDKGVMPEAGSIRSEEFVNAFDYRDPEPAAGVKVSFAWERSEYPFGHHRDLLRFSLKTAAQGRQGGRPLNIVLLLDKSGSMERADRVEITRKALAALAGQLQGQDTLSVIVFARTARLWADGVAGDQALATLKKLDDLTPEGGTNLEEAMRLAYETALRHYRADGDNRVVLLTDGAANLGEADPDALKEKVEANRMQGIAFDCFGIGWEGYNDEMLATLSRSGGGRYGFINTPEEAATDFAGRLAGALHVAAVDVKTQVEFNPNRVTSFRQIGYARDQLTKEQFRDNSVKAAQLGSAESGNALYVVEVNPTGDAPLCTVRVRYRLPGATDYHEQEWTVPYTGAAVALEKASPSMRLAATACAFSEWLADSPYAGEVTPDKLLTYLAGVPEAFGANTRPGKLETMIRQAKSITGK